MARILITGSRDWEDETIIQRAIWNWIYENVEDQQIVQVVHGNARGADRMAGAYARSQWWLEEEVHAADWSTGMRAGLDRNELMVHLGADVCLAFIKDGSGGATHCANYAETHGIATIRFVV